MWARRQYETQYLPVQCFGVRVVRRQRAICWDVAGNVIVWDLVRNVEERRIRAHTDRIYAGLNLIVDQFAECVVVNGAVLVERSHQGGAGTGEHWSSHLKHPFFD